MPQVTWRIAFVQSEVPAQRRNATRLFARLVLEFRRILCGRYALRDLYGSCGAPQPRLAHRLRKRVSWTPKDHATLARVDYSV